MGDNGAMSRPDATQKLAAVTPKSGSSRKTVAIVVAAVAVVVIAATVIAGVAAGRGVSRAEPTSVVTTDGTGATTVTRPYPKGATGFGGPIVVNPGVSATVPVLDVYEDPQCPICQQYEAMFGPAVPGMVAAGQVRLVVHTMTFLDTNLRNDSSRRAAAAAFCAADQDRFSEYMSAVYAGQPAQEGQGWTNGQLTGFATQAGISGEALSSWQACVDSKKYAAHVDALEVASEKSGVTGTPTVRLNGKKVTLTTPADLVAQVKAATP